MKSISTIEIKEFKINNTLQPSDTYIPTAQLYITKLIVDGAAGTKYTVAYEHMVQVRLLTEPPRNIKNIKINNVEYTHIKYDYNNKIIKGTRYA